MEKRIRERNSKCSAEKEKAKNVFEALLSKVD
jgi:hypothetical protein